MGEHALSRARTTACVSSRIRTRAKHWHATDFNIVYCTCTRGAAHLNRYNASLDRERFPYSRIVGIMCAARSSFWPSDNRISVNKYRLGRRGKMSPQMTIDDYDDNNN